jgi:hypothetical protein
MLMVGVVVSVDVCIGIGVAVRPGVASHPSKPDKSINESNKMIALFENISFLILFSFTVNKAPNGLAHLRAGMR